MKAILFREDGYDTANFVSPALARLLAQNCSRGYARHEGLGVQPPPYCNAMYLAPSTVYKPPRERRFQAYRHADMQPPSLVGRPKKDWKHAKVGKHGHAREKSSQFRASRPLVDHSVHLVSLILFNYACARVWHHIRPAKVFLILVKGGGGKFAPSRTNEST